MENHTYISGLKPEEDSFGNNIFESFNSGNLYSGYEIEERSDGRFILYGDSNSYFEPFEEWTSIQKKIAPMPPKLSPVIASLINQNKALLIKRKSLLKKLLRQIKSRSMVKM